MGREEGAGDERVDGDRNYGGFRYEGDDSGWKVGRSVRKIGKLCCGRAVSVRRGRVR